MEFFIITSGPEFQRLQQDHLVTVTNGSVRGQTPVYQWRKFVMGSALTALVEEMKEISDVVS